MKYLFFDLECSNCFGGIGKVCEFGAVLTDENFNILRQYDIPMSPGKERSCRFDKNIFKRDPSFGYAYSFDYYFEQPEFPFYYSEIKELIEDTDTIIFGYAVENDIAYLNASCARYNLDSISYTAYDLKKIKSLYSNIKQKVKGLKGAFIDMCGKELLVYIQPHLARDDAKMAMMILKSICDKTGYNVNELCELCCECTRDSNAKNVKNTNKSIFCKKIKPSIQKRWGEYSRNHINELTESHNLGKRVTISSKLKEDEDNFDSIINLINEKNFVPSDKINSSDYLVCVDEADIERIKFCLKYPYEGKIITVKDFECIC